MDTKGKESGNYVQCMDCGHIYIVHKEISIEKSIVHMECPGCGCDVGLNVGDDPLDVYTFYDPYLDERYYTY